jgi:molecular chaperone GrpE
MAKNRKSSSKTGYESQEAAKGRHDGATGKETRSGEEKKERNDTSPKTDQEELRDTIEEQEGRQEQEEVNMELVLAEKLREQEDRYLRLAAEYDNYRKRTLREKAVMTKTAGYEIIYDLLPVIDDMDRAVEAVNATDDVKAIRKGIELIHGKFRDFLALKGVKEIKATGTEFNTDLHEAVTKIPASSKKDRGKVVDVIEKGYQIDGKVIRYAKVVIGE